MEQLKVREQLKVKNDAQIAMVLQLSLARMVPTHSNAADDPNFRETEGKEVNRTQT